MELAAPKPACNPPDIPILLPVDATLAALLALFWTALVDSLDGPGTSSFILFILSKGFLKVPEGLNPVSILESDDAFTILLCIT